MKKKKKKRLTFFFVHGQLYGREIFIPFKSTNTIFSAVEVEKKNISWQTLIKKIKAQVFFSFFGQKHLARFIFIILTFSV